MGPMNNPLMALVSAMQNGGNPMGLLNMMAQSNSRIGQAMQMMQGKSPEQLRDMAMAMCKERGTSPAEVARSLGLRLPE